MVLILELTMNAKILVITPFSQPRLHVEGWFNNLEEFRMYLQDQLGMDLVR